MYTLHHYAKHAALWLLPAFIVWWFSLQPILLPALATIQDNLLQATYQQARASLNTEIMTNWYIQTQLILEKKSAAGNFQTWNLRIGNLTPLTLGLPLTWILLLASPNGRLRKTVLATLIIVSFILLTIWLKLNHLMLYLLSNEQPVSIYITQVIQIRHQLVPVWSSDVLKFATEFMSYFIVIIIPALLAYWLNRDWWQAQYQLSRLQK